MSLTATDLFCGAGGSSLGAEFAGVTLRLGLNHWERAIETHSMNFEHADHDCEDVSSLTTARIRGYPDSDILLASPECLAAGTLVLLERGWTAIEDVAVGDRALTHIGRFRPVVRTQSRKGTPGILRGQGHTPGLRVTGNHRLWARVSAQIWEKELRQPRRHVVGPDWVAAEMLGEREAHWGTPTKVEALPVPAVTDRPLEQDPAFWWMVGRWLGDGTVRLRRRSSEVEICCGHHEAAELEEQLARIPVPTGARAGDGELRWRSRRLRTATLFATAHDGLARWLVEHFGRLSHGKTLPAWVYGMDREAREALLAGYVSADGSLGRRVQIDSVSKRLAIGVRMLAESLGHRASLMRYQQRSDVIEGRRVSVRPLWKVSWESEPVRSEAFEEDGVAWSRVRSYEPIGVEVEVYNLEVEGDHSYVAEGIAVANCTNHSLAKGARRKKPQASSLFEDGPAGDAEQERSRATMYDVCRFAEQKQLKGRPYKIIIVENVVDAFNWGINDDGGLFDGWLLQMKALGYEHEIVWLNSMFAGAVPQSRDRMYVIFWLRGVKAPDLRFRPLSFCPECGELVEGKQAFKRERRGRPWGRYGPQYIYRCPGCLGTAFPGAFPAASAIDWSVEAQVIGERERPLAEATRERIRRGLERLASEPFAIRLLQSGNPKPLTLPLVTLTARHDMAMVMPVAGNTFERTPGNRARDAQLQPLDTVHATLDRAMVLSGTQNDVGRNALTDPTQVQVTNRAPRLVLSNRAHNMPRDAEAEPTHPVLSGGHLGVIEMQRNGNGRDAITDPVHTVRAGGQHHGVVIANYGSAGTRYVGWARRSGEEPLGTVTVQDHHGLVVPYNGSEARPLDEPTTTIHTRDPLAMVVPGVLPGDEENSSKKPEAEEPATPVGEEEIDACRFRMFELPEIARAMALHAHTDGAEYVVTGNKRERMAQFGNAVTPPAMRALVERCVAALDE